MNAAVRASRDIPNGDHTSATATEKEKAEKMVGPVIKMLQALMVHEGAISENVKEEYVPSLHRMCLCADIRRWQSESKIEDEGSSFVDYVTSRKSRHLFQYCDAKFCEASVDNSGASMLHTHNEDAEMCTGYVLRCTFNVPQ